MAIRRFSTAEPGVKSNRFWDQDTQQGAMVPIASFNGTSATEVLAFTNIPQTYTDLVVVASLATINVSGANSITMSINTGAGFVFSGTVLQGNGGSAVSSRVTATSVWYPIGSGTSLSSTIPTTMTMHIANYTNTANFKPAISRIASDRNGSGTTTLHAGQFLSTAAIDRITFSSNEGGNHWTASSTFTLYGIKAGA